MLNVPRFQLALNSEEPDIVKLGLRQFLQQILNEHGIEETFGTNSIKYIEGEDIESILYPTTPLKVQGLLKDYLEASPQIEEFFILWDLPGREYDADVYAISNTFEQNTKAVAVHAKVKGNKQGLIDGYFYG